MMNLSIIVLVLLIVLFLSGPAHAYLDPGSGSMVLQALLAGVAGLLVLLRYFWNRIVQLFGAKEQKKEQ